MGGNRQRRRRRRRIQQERRKRQVRQPPNEDLVPWMGLLMVHVLASEECSAAEAGLVVVQLPATMPPLTVPTVVRLASLERAVEVADEALKIAPGSRNALAFAAQVAIEQGDIGRAQSLISAAWSAGEPDEGLRQNRAAILLAAGSLVEAVPEIETLCAEYPHHWGPQALRARVLALADQRVALDPQAACPCGSGRPSGACCRPVASDALCRFREGADLAGLSERLRAYLADLDGFMAFVDHRWQRVDGGPGVTAADAATRPSLRVVWGAALVAAAPGTQAGWAVSGDQPPVLEAFASLPDVEGGCPAAIRECLLRARFGLWQMQPDGDGPGLVVDDLLTGMKVCAAPGPGLRAGVADPWSVIVGPLVRDTGVWRVFPGFAVLSPRQADRFVGQVHRMVGLTEAAEGGAAWGAGIIPPSMLAEAGPAIPADLAELMLSMAWRALPDLLPDACAGAEDARRGDVRALVAADDVPAIWAGLLERDDMVPTDDELLWTGHPVSGADPARWSLDDAVQPARAAARIDEDFLAIWADSEECLADLLAISQGLEPSARIARRAAGPGTGSALWASPSGPDDEALARWQQAWPEEALFSLGCRTPREAAGGVERRLLLELELRELEFWAARARRHGLPAPDMAAIRERLELKDR